jgi:hypothetical protein
MKRATYPLIKTLSLIGQVIMALLCAFALVISWLCGYKFPFG